MNYGDLKMVKKKIETKKKDSLETVLVEVLTKIFKDLESISGKLDLLNAKTEIVTLLKERDDKLYG